MKHTRMRFTLLAGLIVLLCNSTPLFAQVTIREFLKSALEDHELKSYDDQLKYLQKKPYRLSPLQKLEFRTESNQLDPARQDYAIRFNPANPWEVRSNTNYFKGYESVLSFERDFAWKESLMTRYMLIIELLHDTEMKNLLEEDKKLTETQIAIMDKQQYSDFFAGDDYVKLKLRQMDEDVELEEVSFGISNQISKIIAKYPSASTQTIDWNYHQVISIDRIEKVVDSLVTLEETSVSVQYREQKIKLAAQEYKLEKTGINLGFLQTQYQPYRIDQDRNPWNISLGVTIPVTNPNKGDMTKRQLEVIEAEHELEETKAELQSEKIILRNEIKNLISRHRELQLKIDDLGTGRLAKTLATINNSNPAAIVQFNSNILKLKTIAVKLKESIMLKYVEFLESTDRLQHRPLINYLSDSLDEIQ